jgi:hypothetical protein
MLSETVQFVNIRAISFAFHLTRFPLSAQMATRLGKSRACFGGSVVNFTTRSQKHLTSKIVAPTMQTLTGTYVLVDKSEQAEEGARSFLLLWLV